MKITGLIDLIAGLDPVSALQRDTESARIYGLLHAAKPAVIAALVRQSAGMFVVVTAHPQSAHDLAEELRFWTDVEVVLFPAIEALPYERVRLDRELLSARAAAAQAVSSRAAGIVVAPVRALLQPLQVAHLEHQATVLSVGDRIDLERLLSSWTDSGYAPVTLVDEPGTFARRGGVIDVFPAGREEPVRIELFGHEIESMRLFEPVTQRSIRTVEGVQVPPIASLDDDIRVAAVLELADADTSTMNAEARTRWLDDLAALETGAGFDELAVFAPYLAPDQVSLLDALSSPGTVLIDTADETWTAMHDLWDQALEVQAELERAGDLPRDLKPALIDPARIRQSVARHRCVELAAGTDVGGAGHDWSGLFTSPRLYGGRMRAFARDMAEQRQRRTVVTCSQPERIVELLHDEGLQLRRADGLPHGPDMGVTVLPLSVAEGWLLPAADLALLTDYELFGRARSRPVIRKLRRARDAFFVDFAPGDHVVHVEHGIGRFEGITRMRVGDAEREYALVQYAGTDRLYVPTDQLERLTRYVGVSEAPPTLNRLGGADWQRARQRAMEAAADIAGELIDLYSRRMARPGHAFEPDTPWQGELEASFAYPDTPDQLRAVEEVKRDMETPRPMDRLVCADVGYGKTEVAVRAAFKAVMDGRQVAILVPTTILAQQHYETFIDRFQAYPIHVEALSRFRTPREQRSILRRLVSGEVDVLIGTHRLLQKDVHFKRLGLLIVDEEQRFGVRHKERLKRLRETVDVLTLTATPIPRTLHMGLVGIREVSVIETPPEGRLPIRTYLQPYDDRLVREAVLRELDRDGQVYLVHNRVATIDAMAERIRRLVPEAQVVVAHGQMDEAHLEHVVLSFAHHEADVLVCSTIIENGLDIPNVNTIVVNNAQRLGLTQLYQLRGRVGRSATQAYAYLLYPRDLRLGHDAARRLEAVFEAQDLGSGFTIAMKDLEIRGAGNLLGAQQSGHAAAIGFDLYTRMIADAVERLRGVSVEEEPLVSIDLPLTMFLPPDYVSDEAERLSLYRRLAAVDLSDELGAIRDEIQDRFGHLPTPVENLLASVEVKLLARAARLTSVSLDQDVLVMRARPDALYDRVSLYQRYGLEARISTNVLRLPRRTLGADWLAGIETILGDMIRLRASIEQAQPVGA